MNNLVNYFGLNKIENELCEFNQILGKKILNNLNVN
jgi:hypothetical protein